MPDDLGHNPRRPRVIAVAGCLLPVALVVVLAAAPRSLPDAGSTPEPRHDPSLLVLLSGDDQGYLEPCGCSQQQLGGLARRHTLIESLAVAGREPVLLSNGGLVKRPGAFYDGKPHVAGALDHLKTEITLLAMERMGYAGVNLARSELALGRQALIEACALVDIPLIATNLVDRGEPALPVRRWLAIERESRRIVVIGLICPEAAGRATPLGAALGLGDPVRAARDALRQAGPADFTIALVRGAHAGLTPLLEQLPDLDLVVVPGPSETPERRAAGSGPAVVISNGHKGKFLAAVSLAAGPDGSISKRLHFEVHAVTDDLPESPAMLDFFSLYLQRLEAEDVLSQYLARRTLPAGTAYAGATRCAACHTEAHDSWRSSRHAASWATLEKAGRTLDPDCVVCHVTGFGDRGGFLSPLKTPALAKVGCEACHGPAGAHLAAIETAGEIETSPVYPGGIKVDVRRCESCHDHEHSPEFEYDSYWSKITHGTD